MAKVNVKMPDDFVKKLSELGSKTDEISEKVLKAGGEIALSKTKESLTSAIGKGTKYDSRSTGELEKSLGLSPMKIDKNGNPNVKIGFDEPRSDGKSNAMIANVLEYGKHGQPARPFIKPAKTASTKPAKEAMIKKFDEEVGKLWAFCLS